MYVRPALCAALTLTPACTQITGANDFGVDPSVVTRDLNFELDFSDTSAHEGTPLDIAVVDQDSVMQARARVMLPNKRRMQDFPLEQLVMSDALAPGDHKLYFFVDTNQNYKVDGAKQQIVEHIWISKVEPDGTGSFVHSTMFQFFDESAFTLIGPDIVFELPPDLGAAIGDGTFGDCVARRFDEQFEDTFEIKVSLTSEDRQVGYFKTYQGNPLPAGGAIQLKGVLDAGNDYEFEVFLDGSGQGEVPVTAPQEGQGNLEIQFRDWYPFPAKVLACRQL